MLATNTWNTCVQCISLCAVHFSTVSNKSLQWVSPTPQSTLDKFSRQYNLFRGGMLWRRKFQALRYQGCYCPELLPILTAEWLDSSPPNIGVDGLNPPGHKCDNRKGHFGGWIYPEYSVAWMTAVVGFDSWQCISLQYSDFGDGRINPSRCHSLTHLQILESGWQELVRTGYWTQSLMSGVSLPRLVLSSRTVIWIVHILLVRNKVQSLSLPKASWQSHHT